MYQGGASIIHIPFEFVALVESRLWDPSSRNLNLKWSLYIYPLAQDRHGFGTCQDEYTLTDSPLNTPRSFEFPLQFPHPPFHPNHQHIIFPPIPIARYFHVYFQACRNLVFLL
jgi:hypothetical protein